MDAALLKDMPTDSWWDGASESFKTLERLIQPMDGNLSDEAVQKHMERVRDGILPWMITLPAGNHQLHLTATNEPLECLVLGTMQFIRFIDLFWEAVEPAQNAGVAIVHEMQTYPVPRVLLSVRSFKFELRYLECVALVRRYPTASLIINTPSSFLESRENSLNENTRKLVKDLQRDSIHLDEEHRLAYHNIRAWGVAKGLFNTKPNGFNSQDFVRTCKPKPGNYMTGINNIITHFFSQMDLPISLPEDCSLEDWERVLQAAQNEPFHMNMKGDSPYFIRVSMMYSGSSKVKGGLFLASIDRRVVVLKERLESRASYIDVHIHPHRLTSASSQPTDEHNDPYEGYLILGLDCPSSSIPLVTEIADRWKRQLDDDTPSPGECFVTVSITERASAIGTPDFDLKPDTRVWPQGALKDDDTSRPKQTSSSEPHQQPQKPPSRSTAKATSKSPSKSPDAPTDPDASKGAKLRPASEILSRLRHDREFSIDDCVVGYKDRHMDKLQEKAAADWISETTHEEFIPQHRIEYVRRAGEIVWDRAARVDKVFGSGSGSGSGG